MRLELLRKRRQISPLGYMPAVLVFTFSLAMPTDTAAGSLSPTGFTPVAFAASSALPPAQIQAPPVATRYYFALFLAGPYGCLDFFFDGNIVSSEPGYSGTYVGLPWLSIFQLDSGHVGITVGPILLMQRSDGIYGIGFIFDPWGINCWAPA